jgi:hypothetical protein
MTRLSLCTAYFYLRYTPTSPKIAPSALLPLTLHGDTSNTVFLVTDWTTNGVYFRWLSNLKFSEITINFRGRKHPNLTKFLHRNRATNFANTIPNRTSRHQAMAQHWSDHARRDRGKGEVWRTGIPSLKGWLNRLLIFGYSHPQLLLVEMRTDRLV